MLEPTARPEEMEKGGFALNNAQTWAQVRTDLNVLLVVK